MADVGLGELLTVTGRKRSRKAKEANKDSTPLLKAMDQEGGIIRVDGGRSYVTEALSGQNSTVGWVGENGRASLANDRVVDAAEYTWRYLLGSVTITYAERLQNSGGSDTKLIDLVGKKYLALENTQKNIFHSGLLSNGTGDSGLQIPGLAALVSTTPTTGTVGGIDRSDSDAVWFRNQKFATATDWSDGSVDAGNVLRFLDKLIDLSIMDGTPQANVGFLGATHWEYASAAIGAKQFIMNQSGEAKAGFTSLQYRGIPLYYGAGINYSGQSAMTATRTYLLNTKDGGVNLVYHKEAEFDMLEPVESADQAAFTRLMLTMCLMSIGALAATCIVGFDA